MILMQSYLDLSGEEDARVDKPAVPLVAGALLPASVVLDNSVDALFTSGQHCTSSRARVHSQPEAQFVTPGITYLSLV